VKRKWHQRLCGVINGVAMAKANEKMAENGV